MVTTATPPESARFMPRAPPEDGVAAPPRRQSIFAGGEDRDRSSAQSTSAQRLRLQTTHYFAQLDNACCVCCLPDGNICVSDTGNHRLLVISSETGELISSFGRTGGGPRLSTENVAASDAEGIARRRVSVIEAADPTSPAGSFTDPPPRRRSSFTMGPGDRRSMGISEKARLRGPRGLAADATAVYVCDCYNCCIKKFALADGKLLGTAGGYGDAEGRLRYPYGLVLSPLGVLYVSDSANARISAFRAEDLTFQFCFWMQRGSSSSPQQQSNHGRRSSLFVDDSGQPPAERASKIAMRAFGGGDAPGFGPWRSNPLMVKLGPRGRLLARSSPLVRAYRSVGVESLTPRRLGDILLNAPTHVTQPRASLRPSGLTILDDELFVCDGYSRRLQVFSLDGEFRRILQPIHLEGTEKGKLLLVNPTGITALNGRLCVSDRRGDALHMLSPDDGKPVQIVPFLVNRPRGLAGVCTDGVQRVYVVDEMKNELHMLSMQEGDALVKREKADAPREKSDAPRDAALRPETTRSDSTPRSGGSTSRSGASPHSGMTPRSARKASSASSSATPRTKVNARTRSLSPRQRAPEGGASIAGDILGAALNCTPTSQQPSSRSSTPRRETPRTPRRESGAGGGPGDILSEMLNCASKLQARRTLGIETVDVRV